MAFGRVNPNHRLEDQGIKGLGNVYYNYLEPDLIRASLDRQEGRLGVGGALLVTTGKFTGRSPRDKHIVDTPDVREHIWGTMLACLLKVLTPCITIGLLPKGGDVFRPLRWR